MPRFAFAAFAGLALAGCTDGGVNVPFEPPATVILVEPSQFLGAVHCEDSAGAMRRYVATLFDVMSPPGDLETEAIALPSSPPAPCHLGVRFSATPGRRYTAEIDGYDRDDVRPFTPGGRVMVDDDGNVVAPRWTTSCAGGSHPAQRFLTDGGIVYETADADTADADTPDADTADGHTAAVAAEASTEASSGRDLSIAVIAFEEFTVPMRACAPLEDHGGAPGQTGLVIDLSTALVGQQCGDAPGMVSTFTARVRETGAVASGSCEEPLEFTGLVDGTPYTFDVVAEGAPSVDAGGNAGAPSVDAGGDAGAPSGDAGGDAASSTGARYTTLCYGVAAEGLVRRAACDPLRNAP